MSTFKINSESLALLNIKSQGQPIQKYCLKDKTIVLLSKVSDAVYAKFTTCTVLLITMSKNCTNFNDLVSQYQTREIIYIICEQRIPRSACTMAHTDQGLLCSSTYSRVSNEFVSTQQKTLINLPRCIDYRFCLDKP